MGGQHDGEVVVAAHGLEHADEVCGSGRVEIAGRLVGEEQLRAAHESSGDADALSLAAR